MRRLTSAELWSKPGAGAVAGSGAAAVAMAEIEKLAKLLPAVSRNPLKSPKQQPVVAQQQTNKQGGGKWGNGVWVRTPFDLATRGPLMMLLMEKISTPFRTHSGIEMEICRGTGPEREGPSQTMARNFAKFTFLN